MTPSSALLKSSYPQNIFTSGIKMLELCKLSLRAAKRRKEDNNAVNYICNKIKDGNTILDIGAHNGDYIYFLRKKIKSSGKIIAFESNPYFYQNLLHLKNILNWKNVVLENSTLSDTTGTELVYSAGNRLQSAGAIVININERAGDYLVNKLTLQTLDNYCLNRNIQPDFLKIDLGGNELDVLKGASTILKIYKPGILLKAEERTAGAENVLEAFNFLNNLNYKGHFILDSLRIPLTNFDFNVYQNPYNNFYCSYFMFE